ncbi:TrmH family RNA methyltransferase [Acinetobacter sp. c2-A9]|uniref:TrmH family RNA methyltransferase n=1 Tax=Acinetobacter sp. c2-A9 TaxID=3342802 RepID=UPI0035B8491F
MQITTIQSKDNIKIKTLRGLIEQASLRKKQQQSVIEGAHLLETYLANDLQPQAVFTTETGLAHPENQRALQETTASIYVLPEQLFQNISQLGQSSAIMAIINLPAKKLEWDRQQDTLVLDAIQDAGNVGTLLRSAAAVGIRQILCTQGTANIWSPKVLRASMGAVFSLNIFENIDEQQILDGFDIPIFATSVTDAKSLYKTDLRQACVWILGNEGQGVKPSLLAQSQAITIPQPGGQESLNVAVAGSICLFEMMRQRLV